MMLGIGVAAILVCVSVRLWWWLTRAPDDHELVAMCNAKPDPLGGSGCDAVRFVRVRVFMEWYANGCGCGACCLFFLCVCVCKSLFGRSPPFDTGRGSLELRRLV